MSNFWQQSPNDEERFNDGMEETADGYQPPAAAVAPAPRPQALRPAPTVASDYAADEEPTQEYDLSEAFDEDEEDDYTAVLSDARLRLEQGRLYEMLMNHDIFDGLAADAAAVKSVQRQIRKWAKEQMEIMLGMRRETAKIERLEIDFPFNQVEVDVLKMVAKTASKGRSENSDKFVPDVKRTTEEVQVVSQKRQEGLNRIGSPKATQAAPAKIAKPTPAQEVATARPQQRPQQKLQQKPAAPIQRKSVPLTSAQQKILAETGVTQEQIEQTFDTSPLSKPVNEMTTDELIAHNTRASARRGKTVKNPQSVPMPSPDQEAMIVQSRMMDLTSQPPPGLAQVLSVMSGKK